MTYDAVAWEEADDAMAMVVEVVRVRADEQRVIDAAYACARLRWPRRAITSARAEDAITARALVRGATRFTDIGPAYYLRGRVPWNTADNICFAAGREARRRMAPLVRTYVPWSVLEEAYACRP